VARVRLIGWVVSVALFVILCSSGPAGAQSFGFGVGGYYSTNCERCRSHDNVDVDQKQLWSLELYFRSILNCQRNWRLGVRMSFLNSRIRSINPPQPLPPGFGSSKHWMTSLMVSYQRKLLNRGPLYFGAYLSTGITFLGHEGGDVKPFCNPPFCTLDETEFSLQPGVDYMVSVYKGLGIRVSGGYNFLSGSQAFTYPFSSGFLFEGGLFFEIPHRDSD
jgi:hypothetical protein